MMRTLLVAIAISMLPLTAMAVVTDNMPADPGYQMGRDNGTDQFGVSNNWQGFYNPRGHNGGSPTLDSWASGDTLSNCVLAGYVRQDLADTIAQADIDYGYDQWQARVLLTPPTWVTWPNDIRLTVGVFTCEQIPWYSLNMTSTKMDKDPVTGNNIPWPVGDGKFEGMVNAEIPLGQAALVQMTSFTFPQSYNDPIVHWKFPVPVPNQWFRDYAAGLYTGFFASNTGATPASHYNGNQWGHGSGYMDLELPEPATMGLLLIGSVVGLIRRKR